MEDYKISEMTSKIFCFLYTFPFFSDLKEKFKQIFLFINNKYILLYIYFLFLTLPKIIFIG